MDRRFSETLSSLRIERGISQRKASADLKISQALLSHYENGVREPGLIFVCRACDYYEVTADYLLGRSELREPPSATPALMAAAEELRALADRLTADC